MQRAIIMLLAIHSALGCSKRCASKAVRYHAVQVRVPQFVDTVCSQARSFLTKKWVFLSNKIGFWRWSC